MTTMTRKHFQLIADAVLESRRAEESRGARGYAFVVDSVAAELARNLARTNPRFDADRFLRACRGEK